MIYSLQVERHVLSGLLKHQDLFADIDVFLTENDFYNDVHCTIYSIFKNIKHKGENVDKVLLAEKIKNLGISFKDEINIFDYIDNLSFSQITEEATMEACKELIKLRVRREISSTADKLKEYVTKNSDESLDSIITKIDQIYNKKVSSYSENDMPINIFEGVEDLIEEIGNSPKEDTGLITPYSEFNRMYGGLKNGNIYAIASRPGQGKSTWLNDICFKTSINPKNKTKTLILDTEMQTVDIQLRMVASLSGVPVWYLETGNWKKSPNLYKLFQEKKSEILKIQNQVDHVQVSGKPIHEVISIIKRWYFAKVGRGNPCVVIYDYIKLTGESDKNKQEYQLIGDKVNSLKELCSELNIPILTACQLNRSAENGVDDSSAISQSDRLQWFASFVGIFRRKTVEEIADDGEEFGSHKLIPLATRFQGKDSAGHHDLVRIKEGKKIKYAPNYLSFNIQNFNVEEKGTLEDIISARALRPELDDSGDGEIL